MRMTVSIAALASLIGLAAIGVPSATASVPVDIHVVTNDGGQLANLRQYAPTAAKVRTFAGDDCIDPTPPAKQSSGQTYRQSAPNMLSAVDEASDATPSLQPFRISDADFSQFGALTICSIGAPTPPGFWFLKTNHVANTTGADQTFIKPGDQLTFYRTPSDFTADEELSLDAPARATPGAPVIARVLSYTGEGAASPAVGATVTGGAAPASVDAAGNATVTFATEGVHTLVASKDYNDVPSRAVTVCVAQELDRCPAVRGLQIVGSHEADFIQGTPGADHVKARAGRDKVRALAGDDRVDVRGGGKDRVNCGGGQDRVKLGKGDKAGKNCEQRSRKGKKGKRGKGKGKSKK
jgi:RTX calcium-binding nonapeptide repeat (4 copies)